LYCAGKWLAEAQSEGTNVVKKHLTDAIAIYSKFNHSSCTKAFFALADYILCFLFFFLFAAFFFFFSL
jgi:hypothetical protein